MIVKNIEMINFRNYKKAQIEFGNNLNIILGSNAQGKTNILEAIFLCSAGKSHRTAKDSDMVRLGENNFFVRTSAQSASKLTNITVFYEEGKGKSIRINDNHLTRIGQLIGNLYSVMFSPEDLSIVKEGPGERRRFIDLFISQIKPSYLYDLQKYMKILKQKNTLLKQRENKESVMDMLQVWNENLAETGARIMYARKIFLDKISAIAAEIHSNISGKKEELALKYDPSFKIDTDSMLSAESIREEYLKEAKKIYKKEIILSTTLIGPQKDDVNILLNGTALKQYGSQGQQRTAALSMKIAEIEIIRQETGEMPVLLLDDVMSELDSDRQDFLLEAAQRGQVFITSTEESILTREESKNAKILRISNGEIDN